MLMLLRKTGLVLAMIGASFLSIGCSTAPKPKDQAGFVKDAQRATEWFYANVEGLDQQIADSSAYITYPAVGQWGFGISGGQFGRGMLARPDGTQIGWAAINTASAGLQIGGRGFKMLVVFENEVALNQFRENKLTGSVSALSVAGDNDKSKAGSFTEGVVIYEGSSTGLIAGVNVGLNFMRYKDLDDSKSNDESEE
jgi:lipid-binding SYLF domain-containing protein